MVVLHHLHVTAVFIVNMVFSYIRKYDLNRSFPSMSLIVLLYRRESILSCFSSWYLAVHHDQVV